MHGSLRRLPASCQQITVTPSGRNCRGIRPLSQGNDMSSTIPRPRRQGFSALLLSLICLSTLHAASFELPPLNTPASTEHHVGKMIWADLVTPDLNAAERFYGGL